MIVNLVNSRKEYLQIRGQEETIFNRLDNFYKAYKHDRLASQHHVYCVDIPFWTHFRIA